MKVLVLNGSPKGKLSVTVHSAKFLQSLFKEDQFEFVNIGIQIKHIEKNFNVIIESILNADLILFSYPIYTFLVPYQLHKFIELLKKYIKENQIDLSDKFVTQITTSKHFYDHTAHQFIEDNVHDLGMLVLKGFSADMTDLLNEKGQAQVQSFWQLIHFQITNQMIFPKKAIQNHEFQSHILDINTEYQYSENQKKSTKDVVIVTDLEETDQNLINMVHYFRVHFSYKTRLINLRDFPFKSGCLGCFKCATTGNCVIPDQFDLFLRSEILNGDAIVYAFTIKDHSMGSLFKLYDDRQFCNGHRTVSIGKPIGYIVNGRYELEFNLQTIIESRAQVGQQYLAGVARNDFEENGKTQTQQSIIHLAKQMEYALENKVNLPQNFYGIGGLKIFRDLIFETQGLMKEDYKFYKKHQFFDFPHKNWKSILFMKFFGLLMSNRSLQKKYAHKLNQFIIQPYQKIIERSTK
ncbi:MAG: hypothetical protein H6Q25_566 [Bacteroidetes bacterium]|nr:hypothetical protein [Bacteroidota bacterium]